MTIFLIRHAEYDNSRHILPGRLPVELSEKGKEQAKKMQKFFASKKIEKIFSSEVLRCKQTSEIISSGKIPIVYDKRLLEVLGAYQAYWDEDPHYAYWMRDSLGGELNRDVQNRMIDFWKNAGFETEKNYIVCSHGDPLYFLYLYLINGKLPEEVAFGQKIVWPKIYLPIAGIWPVEKKDGEWKVGKIITLPTPSSTSTEAAA